MSASHPLSPLSAVEVQAAVALVKALPEFSATVRIISIMLEEPSR